MTPPERNNALLVIDCKTSPLQIRRYVRVPWMTKPVQMTNEAELHSLPVNVEAMLETFMRTPHVFEVFKPESDEPEAA